MVIYFMEKFLALYRTSHGILDMAIPGFVVLLWLGHFPGFLVLAVALVTAVAGYAALDALNDIFVIHFDCAKFVESGP